jgi:hypothetical protein
MSAAIAAAGAAFIAGFMWREVVIGWAALRWQGDMPVSRRAMVSGYYATVTGTPATRGSLAIACAAVLVFAVVGDGGSHPAARLTTLGCIAAVMLLSAAHTWPMARRLAARIIPPDREPAVLRRLTALQVTYALLMFTVVGVQAATVDSADLAGVVAAAAAAFLAATLWNEVLIDQPHATKTDPLSASDRSTLLGYYAVMTNVAARPNLAAVSAAILAAGWALGDRIVEGDGGPSIASGALFVVFLALAGGITWPSAVRLGGAEIHIAHYRKVTRRLGRYHALFVVLLLAITAFQVYVLA